jgi:hypothetical protein
VVNLNAGLMHWSSTTFVVLSSLSKTKYSLPPCHYTQLNQYSLKWTRPLFVRWQLVGIYVLHRESPYFPPASRRSLIMCSRLQPVSTQPTRPAYREGPSFIISPMYKPNRKFTVSYKHVPQNLHPCWRCRASVLPMAVWSTSCLRIVVIFFKCFYSVCTGKVRHTHASQ